MTETIHGVRFSTQFPFYRAAADSLALADFAPARGRIADLGCGAGLIGLLLCAKAPGCRVTGFDLAPEAVDEARENAAANGLDGRFSAVLCDLREAGKLPPAGSFHAAVSNPPYHPASGGRSPDALRDRARCAAFLPPDALCAAAGHLVRAGGGCWPSILRRLRAPAFRPSGSALSATARRAMRASPSSPPAAAAEPGLKFCQI